MKRKLIIKMSVIALMVMQFSTLSLMAQSRDQATWVASEQHFADGTLMDNPINIGDYVQCQFAKGMGSNTPTYYVSSDAVRVYGSNTITFTPLNGASIQQVALTCKKNGGKQYLPIASITNIGMQSQGDLEDPAPNTSTPVVVTTWTGECTKGLVFTMKTSGQRCVMQIDVTYTSPSNTYYHVTYTANDGVGEDIVDSYAYNSMVTVRENPFDRDEFVFSHWNTAADGSGTSYNPNETFTIIEDVTLYAQWTTSSNLFVDVLNPNNVNAVIGDATGYANWEMNLPNNLTPRVTYKGKSSKDNNYIQMNSSISGTSSYSGIVTTHTNNLKAKKVKLTWNGATDTGRTLDIYGKNVPYSGTTDLYGDTQGTFLGSIVNGTSTELDIESLGTYSYIGIRSNSGAVYLSEIRIIWETLNLTAPIILIEPSNVDLGNVLINNPLSVNFTVSQANLSADIALTTNCGTLSVGGETVTTIEAGAVPTLVTWTYTPVAEGEITAQIGASSGTVSQSLNISAKVLPAAAQTLHDSKASFITHGNTSACINLADVEVIGQSGNYLYLQDAETGVLVYGAGAPTLQTPCKFTEGYLLGTYTDYHDIIELTNFQFVDVETTQAMQLTAVTTTVDEILANPSNYDSRYVQLSDVHISNWSVAGTSASLAFHDRFQTGYATKTAPEATDAFTVKGLVNGYYSSGATNYQIDPIALADISTSEKAASPSVSPSGSATSIYINLVTNPSMPLNTVAHYRINQGEWITLTNAFNNINLFENTSLEVYSSRDFYQDSDILTRQYTLPSSTYTVRFSINGVINPANNALVSNQLQENQTPSVTTYGDFAFAGWSLSESSTETITLPYDVNGSTTLYAVYTKGQEFIYNKVNQVSEFVDGEYVIIAEGGSGRMTIKNASSTNSPTAYFISELGISISNAGTLEGGDLSEVTWNFNGTSDNMTITSTAAPTNYLYIIGNSSTGVRVGHTSDNTSWRITEDLTVSEQFNMQCNGRYMVVYNDQDWRSYTNLNNANGYPRLLIFKKQAVITGNAPRYTRVFWNETATSNMTITGPSIVPSGYYLDMAESTLTNSEVAANLLIENNASLKMAYGNTGVMATVKKDIVGYVSDTVRTGWHLLSSPVGAFSTSDTHVSGLMVGDYDLYAFDQAQGNEWQNAEAQDIAFGEQGGMLYANKANTTITFTGELTGNVGHLDLVYASDARLSGWNLIGNPYTCEGYLMVEHNGEGAAITDYYKLKDVSENGKKFSKLIATSIDTPVSSMEGVFVQAPSTGYKYWFVNSNRGSVAPDAEFINIKVRGNDGEVMDMARVRFDQGGLLGKFNIGDGGSQLYIPLAGKNYAVVPSQHHGELPLNFKAAEDGNYTISVDLNKAELTFLHLIDNMTGADIDLLETPEYTFTAKASDYASRFRLVFSADGISDNESSFAYFNGSEWVVAGLQTDATLQVIDMLGRVVVSKNAQAGISANEMSQGIYVLRLISGDNVKTQKIINK